MGQGGKKRSSDLYSTFQEGSFMVVFHVLYSRTELSTDYLKVTRLVYPRLVILNRSCPTTLPQSKKNSLCEQIRLTPFPPWPFYRTWLKCWWICRKLISTLYLVRRSKFEDCSWNNFRSNFTKRKEYSLNSLPKCSIDCILNTTM